MSEAGVESAGRDAVWVEKYRPQTLADVAGQEAIVERLQQYVDRDDLQHMLFAGQAGIGKCATGDTPVLTSRGLTRMEDIVECEDGFDVPPDGLEVLTFAESGEFEYVPPSHTYAAETEEVIHVDTRDGVNLTVTPEHRLLVVTENGLTWRPAVDLEQGDRVARPLRAPLPVTEPDLNWVERLDGKCTYVHVSREFAERFEIPAEANEVGTRRRIIAGLRRGNNRDAIAEAADTTRKHVMAIERDVSDRDLDEVSTVCSLTSLRNLDCSRETLQEHVRGIQRVSPTNNARSRVMTPPWEITPEIATFVGLAVSEARIDEGRIKFYNTEERLLDQFADIARSTFGVEPRRGTQHGVDYVDIGNRALTHYLETVFGVFGDGGDEIGSTVLEADEASRTAFLQAVFDAEAHVTDGGIVELTQKDGDVITLLSYLLAGFGIPSRRREKTSRATNGTGEPATYDRLLISGSRHLSRFEEIVGFTVEPKRRRLAKNAARESNPNHDTIPVQATVDELCETLYLNKSTYVPATLNPESPGRERYLGAIGDLLDEANAKLEIVQESLEALDDVESACRTLDRVPLEWTSERARLEPLETRQEIAAEHDIGTYELLRYARGEHTPYANRVQKLLASTDVRPSVVDTQSVRSTMSRIVSRLGIPYADLAHGIDLHGHQVKLLLENDDHEVASLCHFPTLVSRLEAICSQMASASVIETLSALDLLVTGDLYFDTVEAVDRQETSTRVYDLSVPDSRNYVAGAVPMVMHNTTAAMAIARELYGEDWDQHFLELNASDERGIDVVRDRIKSFARTSFGGAQYRIIFLDEADALTSDAQSALRRTMEQFSNNVRFILSCNYSSQIIDPIQSRCAVFRFSPISDEAVEERLRDIAGQEDVELTQDGIDALVYAADGDMRAAINALQAASAVGDVVDEDTVFAITSTARPEEIHDMVESALAGDFTAARAKLDDLLTDQGIAGGDVIDQLHRTVWEFDVPDERAVQILDRVGEADYRITEGASERIQLEAMLASLALSSPDDQ